MVVTRAHTAATAESFQGNGTDQLDDEIAKVRAEIQALSKRRNLLSAALLKSTKIQSQFRASPAIPASSSEPSPGATQPLLLAHVAHNESNIHRLAFGVTAFPFHDPSPEFTDNPLLGIRFDIPSRNGKFERAPYYVFCKKTPNGDDATSANLTVYHHTIPAHVPLQSYITKYLPDPVPTLQGQVESDEGYYGSTPSSTPASSPQPNHAQSRTVTQTAKQDLHGFVDAINQDLTSWILREEAISYLAESLDLLPTSPAKTVAEPRGRTSVASHNDNDDDAEQATTGKFSVRQVSSIAADARVVRIVWQNDTLAWVRISDDGSVEKAVVYGEHNERLHAVERALAVGNNNEACMIIDLLDHLDKVEQLILHSKQKTLTQDTSRTTDTNMPDAGMESHLSNAHSV